MCLFLSAWLSQGVAIYNHHDGESVYSWRGTGHGLKEAQTGALHLSLDIPLNPFAAK